MFHSDLSIFALFFVNAESKNKLYQTFDLSLIFQKESLNVVNCVKQHFFCDYLAT